MAIISLQMDFVGEANSTPRLGRLNTTDSGAQVLSPGYLDSFVHINSIAIYPTDLIAVVTTDGNAWAFPHIVNGSIQLNGI